MEKDCGAWINLLSHRVKARLDAAFQNLGITGVQSRVIYYILAHCKEGPVYQRDIENAFSLSRSTATGILQLLEKNGIILRESVSNDARLKSLVPTRRAFELTARVSACLKETDRLLTRGLSEGQILLFKEMAAQMLRNLDDWDDEAFCCTDCPPPGQDADSSTGQ
ncbi:MAG TPA: MarR family winged helix-turn-helix transcriptional regulator [Candidatus Eisenbergiella merdavium]|uniref:MarR family winged helix-turn-helix transcriptional regulator n=1 Tax=Candidatus Eisenbergiella merdavium TaxID=2838551 RepID=A0A9D2SP96_9FIRM|nr:MarR family winged helix-turn-helix transcriptional regulator [Candidatus Eisenbergiella merdavium]